MKKNYFIMFVLMSLITLTAQAQHFTKSKYYDRNTGRLDYTNGSSHFRYNSSYGPNCYFGLRLGASFSTVISDDPYLDSGSARTGLNVGAYMGVPLSRYTPVYLEGGLVYNEKGGKQGSGRDKFTYGLNYLQLPLTVKYSFSPDGHFAVQPYAGGYLACGVGGKIKNFGEREAYSSFGDDKPGQPRFDRFDGGIKVGCGFAYDALYADLSYEYGLANISNDSFDRTRNSSFMLSVGVNF